MPHANLCPECGTPAPARTDRLMDSRRALPSFPGYTITPMTRRFRLLVFLALSGTGWGGGNANAGVAKWADTSLPVQEGLELWLDAVRENEAREAHYMNRLADGEAMEIWHDSSGHARHLSQWTSDFRPRWSRGTVHFDGNDYLAALLPPGLDRTSVTVFLVAGAEQAEGDFPGLLSLARRDESDYTSGLVVDLGGQPSAPGSLERLNVEGAGQAGERNLLTGALPTGRGHILTVTAEPGGTLLRADGQPQGRRDRGDVAMRLERAALGARFVAPEMRHFLRGTIAEVLVFGRRLEEAEIGRVEAWLRQKHRAFLTPPDPDSPGRVYLQTLADAPVVQMFVPDFEVVEIPVRLTNLNNIEYALDGRLFAGGYDGRFHLLRDTDGDGIEDRVDTFSPEVSDDYPLGMVVKHGMPHALLADELVRFRDTDGDGIPDRRETVLKGWDDPALRNDPGLMHRRVDSAMALAAGPDDDWYITMGSANPGNGYWQEVTGDVWASDSAKSGTPRYSPDKLRGCLLHFDRHGKMSLLASGLRYVMSLQWDRHGELFGTDQEGATWLPNGNPFDELLHLQPGRHYGFPPRHPGLLPDVIDEPSVWNYAPQHQGTCGFRFNGPQEGRARFGPPSWAHDAIVTGEARGKLWRTSLSRTPDGYVAVTRQIAGIAMLVTDCAISPQGDLVICCHSGPPDWGTGPSGEGRLFRIRYRDTGIPQPVSAWALDETRTVVAFDRPLRDADREALSRRIIIEHGESAGAGDRFETLRPGYAVVRRQLQQPRYRLPVTGVTTGPDPRTLLLETPPRTAPHTYGLTMDFPRAEAGIPQAGAIDLAFDLHGLQAEWRPAGGDGSGWAGWLPHPDPAASRELFRGTPVESDVGRFSRPGRLILRAGLDLTHLLQPAVQPGSSLDYRPEPETATITFRSDAGLTLRIDGRPVATGRSVSFTRTIESDRRIPFELEAATPLSRLHATFHTAIDSRERPLGTQRFHLPFAGEPEDAAPVAVSIPEIAGGSRERGRDLFHGAAACGTCHTIHGQGHAVGPDLSNTLHRDYASVLRDILDPNATINPDAVAYQVTLRDGTILVGTRVGDTPTESRFASPGGIISTVAKSRIAGIEALPASLMPATTLEGLSREQVRDLMTFLLTPPAQER